MYLGTCAARNRPDLEAARRCSGIRKKRVGIGLRARDLTSSPPGPSLAAGKPTRNPQVLEREQTRKCTGRLLGTRCKITRRDAMNAAPG